MILSDKKNFNTLLDKISEKIISDITDFDKTILIGIQTRGVYIAERIREIVEKKTNTKLKCGKLDITFYRDDIDKRPILPVAKETKIDFDINDMTVFLVDDVLFTGRTIKAAMEDLMSYGRPEYIKLAVLVDRGNRQLPIQPDYFGIKMSTELNDEIRVHMVESDGSDEIVFDQA